MKISVKLSAPNHRKSEDLILPASYSVLEDTLQKIQSDGIVYGGGRLYHECGYANIPFHFGSFNIFELNHLATLIDSLDFDGECKFIGAYKLLQRDMTLQKAINLTCNIKSNNHINYSPARNEEDLAEFYLENDLIPEVKILPDPSYQWVLNHTDYKKLGEEIKARENGVFMGAGYITLEELDDLYDGTFQMPVPAPHTFSMRVVYREQPYRGKQVMFTLPATQQDVDQLLTEFNVTDLCQLDCFDLECCVPMLDPMDINMEDLEEFNQFAHSLAFFRDNGELPIYKALLDTIPVISLTTAHELCEFVDSFTLQENVRNLADYGKIHCEELLPGGLVDCLDAARYGSMIAEESGVNITQYGTLVPKDNEPLFEKLSQVKKPQSQSMSFGGMSL